MSIFDKLKGTIGNAADKVASFTGNTKETIVIQELPESVEQLQALPEAAMDTPFKTAALTVCALCAYGAEPSIGIEMLNFLKGPKPLTNIELSFLKDRFADDHYYIAFSYFDGATPENDYQPSKPYTLTVESDPYSYQNEGYAKLNIRSGGADSPRQVVLRKAGDGKWYLWEQFLMVGIREPKSKNPWA